MRTRQEYAESAREAAYMRATLWRARSEVSAPGIRENERQCRRGARTVRGAQALDTGSSSAVLQR